ncbi:MAG: hypothetical protein KatS3mg104_1858 [Phycisphaerae bacterium]|jgi:uncharacterized membrane protein (UPF0127 family)|nr:MAG: hypothetical protein KatS3mg104_1858 [Phycisphaerae bacterium]
MNRVFLLLLCLLLWTSGCRESVLSPPPTTASSQTASHFVQVQLGRELIRLEVANDPAKRSRGLMFRSSLPRDQGMLFVFPEAAERGFWMKNTYIPLDIIYLNSERRIISIKQMQPHDLSTTSSDGPAMFAIELNAGRATELGLVVGQVVDIPPQALTFVR